jgi:hypothetical protein
VRADLGGNASQHVASDVLVSLRERYIGPAHDLHRSSVRYAQLQEHRRGRVASIMQASVTDPSGFKELLPACEVSSVVEGFAYFVGEEPALFVPQLSGLFPFPVLLNDVEF